MTRFLSESLQAPRPLLRASLRRLEAANGHPNHDIRFSTEVMRLSRGKLLELGLDPHDSTPSEVYRALQERLSADDAALARKLRTLSATHVSAEADVVAGMVHALKELDDSKYCFAIKNSRLKSLFKKVPPKKAMKRLGYRSLDSFLRHEPPVSAMAAAWLSEGQTWQRKFFDQYKQLKAADFESRAINLFVPTSKKWLKLAHSTVSEHQHNLLSFRELGAMVFLPFPAHAPNGSVTASLSLALHELNEIRASGTFLKLCQVRGDFGNVVRMVAVEEPHLLSRNLDKPVPWQLIQRYYAHSEHAAVESFEPHLDIKDIAWHPVEQTLARIEPRFKFWEQSGHLGLSHAGKAISFNVVDAALNYCNRLPFEKRIAHYFQRSLWHELLLGYLKHESIEQTVMAELQPQLAEEMVRA